jgi:hypothetical protein
MMHATTGLIIDFEVKEREKDKSSAGPLEKIACEELLNRITDKLAGIRPDQSIKAFSTDRSTSVRSMMAKKFPHISHQFDPWHLSKSIKTKLTELGRKKAFKVILQWIRHITNHLWYAASTCQESADVLIKKWRSLIYHIQGKHEWRNENGELEKCEHNELEDERKIDWFVAGSEAFKALSKIVTDPRLLKDIRQLNLCIFTSLLENFHSMLLKYAPKRLNFHPEFYRARIKLSIIDHNSSLNRQPVSIREVYRKSTKRMALQTKKEKKDSSWKFEIVEECLKIITNEETHRVDDSPTPRNSPEAMNEEESAV